ADNTSPDTNENFTFVNDYSGTAGEAVLEYNAETDTTSAGFDNDGDGLSDLIIIINGQVTEADFVL
ncbi:MAG: M10 family metallopeptidase C-terminal domain-containing protein, partial [Caulobacteraceae bacterium]